TAVSLAGAAVPLLLGLALDTGLAEGVSARLLWLALVIVAVGVFGAVTTSVGHAAEVGGWMHGSFTTTRLVGHHVSRTGPAVVAAYVGGQGRCPGVVAAVGMPGGPAVVSFLVRPLQARQKAQRDAAGRLATLATDTVSGLRILRGIGGEDAFAERYRAQSQRVRRAGVRVAGLSSVLEALQVLLPGLFVACVVWLGARQALSGQISPGQLVTFYG